MSVSKKKTYVDVTQLVHWSGRITGIPRVMYELATRFAARRDAVFVSWVKDVGEFCEVDLLQSLERSGQGVVYVSRRATSSKSSVRPAWRSQLLGSPRLKRAVRGVLRRMRVLGPRLVERIETSARNSQLESYQRAVFHEGDTLVIPWGEWWDPSFTDYIVRQSEAGVRLVQMIHDISTTVQPQFFEQVTVSPASYNARVVPIARLILTISQNTKRELTEWLRQQGLSVPPIAVVRIGDDFKVSKSLRPAEDQFLVSGLKGGDYLLCVGTFEAKKNHALFYYAYKLAKTRGIELPRLVIVGRRGYRTDDIYALMTQDPEVKDKFVFMHNASDEELSWLYDHAMFTVLPSFHEGWGIPIAESVARGVPCLCSNVTSMVEIAPGITEHFSPASTDELLAGIMRWLDPESLQKARERTKQYTFTSWDDTFKQVMDRLKELS